MIEEASWTYRLTEQRPKRTPILLYFGLVELKQIAGFKLRRTTQFALSIGSGDKWVKSQTVRWTPPGLFSG